MKIYTKKGDAGQTSLIGGTRVPKHHIRIDTYGTVDELNAHTGLLSTYAETEGDTELLRFIQDRLFTLGSLLATDPSGSGMKLPQLSEADVERLERSIDEMDGQVEPLRNFVLPGGCGANAQAHVCRCVCRRAERLSVQLDEMQPVNETILKFLNRLSDWYFMYSRYMSHKAGKPEIKWTPRAE